MIRNRFISVAHEMTLTVKRTAQSIVLSESLDFGVGIFDKEGRILSLIEGIPVHLLALPVALKFTLEAYRDEGFQDGDIIAQNDPYLSGGSHVWDWEIFKPCFVNDELTYWLGVKAHQMDVGGMTPGGFNSKAVDIHAEGTRYPPIKIYSAGKENRDIWRIILANSRMPLDLKGDLIAFSGALRLGEKRVKEVVARYGKETMHSAHELAIQATERTMRQRISRIPEGTYVGEDSADSDGFGYGPVKVRCNLTVKKDGTLTLDFTGSSKQVAWINTPIGVTHSAAWQAIFTTFAADLDRNQGAYNPLKIIAPEGSVVNPRYPASVGGCTIFVYSQIVHSIWGALAQVIPKDVPSGWGRWYTPSISGVDPRTGELYIDISFLPRPGAGAVWGYDGWPHIGGDDAGGYMLSTPVESYELKTPWIVRKYEFWQDSGGPGKYRGGLGLYLEIENRGSDATLAMIGDGEFTPCHGHLGGRSPPLNRSLMRTVDGKESLVHCKDVLTIPQYGVWMLWNTGGAGVGDPYERSPEKVLDDVINGYVSIESAAKDYGVVINPNSLTVDVEATRKLRRK